MAAILEIMPLKKKPSIKDFNFHNIMRMDLALLKNAKTGDGDFFVFKKRFNWTVRDNVEYFSKNKEGM